MILGRIGALFVLMVLGIRCGVDSPREAMNNSNGLDSEVGTDQDFVHPPEQAFQAMLDYHVEAGFGLVAQTEPTILYLDFDGETVQKGTGIGESFIPCSATVTIPSSNYSASQQSAIVTRVQDHFTAADANVKVVARRPSTGLFTTTIVGGLYSDLGCGSNNTILGIAPYDPGNVLKADITFVFAAASFSATATADAIAHEAAHSFGLEHINNVEAVMNPFVTRSIAGFGEGFTVDAFGNDTTKRQDSVALLQETLGTVDASGGDEGTDQSSAAWHNQDAPLDSSGDGCVSALDALLVINFLNREGVGVISRERRDQEAFVDVNGDGAVSAIDALRIINELTRSGARCNPEE